MSEPAPSVPPADRPELGAIDPLPPALEDTLSRSTEADERVMWELHTHLRSLKGQLSEEGADCFAPLCEVGLSLLDAVITRGQVKAGETLAAIRQILGYLQETLKPAEEEGQLEERFSHLLKAIRNGEGQGQRVSSGLKLINRRRLGEILVSLSMLTSNELERALRMQQVTGRRIGETLLEMGVVSEDQIESALRLQESRLRDAEQGEQRSGLG